MVLAMMPAMSPLAAYGLGKLLGFLIIWIYDDPRFHRTAKPQPSELPHMETLFYDKAYIANLKLGDSNGAG